jgi:hypothetical protein
VTTVGSNSVPCTGIPDGDGGEKLVDQAYSLAPATPNSGGNRTWQRIPQKSTTYRRPKLG